MTTLVLIRHGQTDWNVEGRWQGQADPPLNDTGRAQARHVAEYQSQFGFAALYSSNLRRAMETAQVNESIARHPRQRVGIVAHELPIAIVLCRSAAMGLEHLRDMIPENGTWSKVVLKGAIK